MNRRYSFLLIAGICVLGSSCKKFVDIGPSRNSVPTTAMFVDSTSASSAILAMYDKMMAMGLIPGTNFGSGLLTLCAGQSADELINYSSADQNFFQNVLVQENATVKALWTDAYSYIYLANICIEGLTQSTTMPEVVKNQFMAEAKLVRAFTYFYLTNLYGPVPYITTTDWKNSFGHGRTSVADIYANIVQDLLDAQDNLPLKYPAAGKIRPVKWAATALLARVYLYTGEWAKAEAAANAVITSGAYPALPAPAKAFLANSDEAIWQLLPVATNFNTSEGYAINAAGTTPGYYMQTPLLNAFEPGDQRYTNWVKSNGSYYCPYKYKVYKTPTGGTVTEYYTLLRLAEQYLIRAEARNNQGNTTGAISDLNIIRARAGLKALSSTLTKEQCVTAIEQERRIELFSEWGHRWFDLKRWNRADAVLSAVKSKWKSTAALYPVPVTEINSDPSLAPQNDGY